MFSGNPFSELGWLHEVWKVGAKPQPRFFFFFYTGRWCRAPGSVGGHLPAHLVGVRQPHSSDPPVLNGSSLSFSNFWATSIRSFIKKGSGFSSTESDLEVVRDCLRFHSSRWVPAHPHSPHFTTIYPACLPAYPADFCRQHHTQWQQPYVDCLPSSHTAYG